MYIVTFLSNVLSFNSRTDYDERREWGFVFKHYTALLEAQHAFFISNAFFSSGSVMLSFLLNWGSNVKFCLLNMDMILPWYVILCIFVLIVCFSLLFSFSLQLIIMYNLIKTSPLAYLEIFVESLASGCCLASA